MEQSEKALRRTTMSGVMIGLLACVVLLLSAAPALAGTVTNDRPLLFSFDGSDTTAGQFAGDCCNGITAVAVDNASGDVYVINGKPGAKDGSVDRFNAAGEAKDFPAGPAAGTSSLFGPSSGLLFKEVEDSFFFDFFSDLAVDNSGGLGGPGEGEQGRLYVSGSDGPVHAFDPEGNHLWTLPRKLGGNPLTEGACGLAVDSEGHLWVGVGNRGKVLEFDNAGSPPAQIGSFTATHGLKTPCRLGIDNSGTNAYVANAWNFSIPSGGLARYTNGVLGPTITPTATRAVAVDQTIPAGHLFALHDASFREFDSSGAPVGTFGGDLIGNGRGIAYNPVLDRTYVSDLASKTVKVFGPVTTGPAPDVTSKPATSITRTSARAQATINPQGLNHSYHFEWARGGNEVQHLKVNARSGTFKVSITPGGCCTQFTTDPLPFDVSPEALEAELEGLGPIGAGNVSVSGAPADGQQTFGEYDIAFTGALGGVNVDQLSRESIDLAGSVDIGTGAPYLSIDTTAPGPVWATASSSPPQSIAPTDAANHDVNFDLSGLRSNTSYSVRLVGINTANDLSAYASPPTSSRR